MVENIAPWYHGAIWALREHCVSYVHALICLSGLTLELYDTGIATVRIVRYIRNISE